MITALGVPGMSGDEPMTRTIFERAAEGVEGEVILVAAIW
jgi:CO dehydrogenase/acetyl-CoA synthase delta subunit